MLMSVCAVHPRTLNKALSSRSAYAGGAYPRACVCLCVCEGERPCVCVCACVCVARAAQALMVISAILSSFYIVIDIANWFTRATQDNKAVIVLKYSQDAWYFYVITTIQGECPPLFPSPAV